MRTHAKYQWWETIMIGIGVGLAVAAWWTMLHTPLPELRQAFFGRSTPFSADE